MFNGCTGYELWDIGHLSSTMSEHGTLRWWENTIVLFGWVASRLWKQINISAGAGRLWCCKMMIWTPSWSQCKHANQEILKRCAEIPPPPSLDQLFPISSLLVPHYWACFYKVMFLDGCRMVSRRHPMFVHPLHTHGAYCHLYDGCVWASLTACVSLRVSQGSFPLAGLLCIKTAIRCNIIRRIYAGIYYLYQEGVWISIVYFQE